MSFLDRFKRKEPNGPAGGKPAGSPPRPARNVEPGAADSLAAATVSPRQNPLLRNPAKWANETPPPPSPSPAVPPQSTHEIFLELGDFLPRIPKQWLHEGPHDVATRLKFEIAGLAERIARGHTTIPLTEIHRRVPEIFREEILPANETEVRFPWQKVMKMLADARSTTAGAPPLEGMTSDAADSLAEKVRARRTPLTPPAPDAAERSGTPPPVAATPASEPVKIKPPAVAPAIPDTKIVASEGALALSLETTGTTLNSSLQDDEKLSREELLRSRDAMRAQLARTKGEFERQIAAVAHERKNIAEERERLVAEMVRAKADADDRIEQIEFEKSVAARTAENLAKATQERTLLQREVSNLKLEMKKTQDSGLRVAELTTERDALAQQQAALSKQIAEFQKRGKVSLSMTGDAAVVGAGGKERLPKESQRAVDELQRRITALETSQREAAIELGREKESKIKLERQIATTDRLNRESSAHAEETYAAMRREFETTVRKREAEVARALKETQEQFEVVNSARARLAVELEETRARLSSGVAASAAKPVPEAWEARAVAQLEADIENYRVRIKTLLEERNSIAAEKETLAARLAAGATDTPTGEEKTAGEAAQLRADTQQLQQELAAAQEARDRLSAQLRDTEAKAAEAGNAQSEISAAQLRITKTTDQLTEAEAARREAEQALIQLRATHEQLGSEKVALAAELAVALAAAPVAAAANKDFGAERAKLARELEAARASSNTTITKLRSEQKQLTYERDAAQKEGEKLLADLDAVNAARQQEREALERDLAATRQARDAEAKAHAELQSVHAQLGVDKTALTAQLADAHAAHAALTADAAAAKIASGNVLAELTADRDDLSEQAHDLARASAALQQNHAAVVAGLREERESLETAKRALENSLADLAVERDRLQIGNDTLASELAGARQQHSQALAALDHERETLRAAKDALTDELVQSKTAYDALDGQLIASRHAHENTQAELAGERNEWMEKAQALTAETEDLRAERAELQSGRSALENSLTSLTAERDQLRAKADTLSSELSGAKQQHSEAFAALDRDREILRATNETHEKAIATLASERDALDASLKALHAESDRAREQHESSLAELTQKLTYLESGSDAQSAASAAARSVAEKSITDLTAKCAELSTQLDARGAELTAQERDRLALHGGKETLAMQLASECEAHENTRAEMTGRFDSLEETRADLDRRLADMVGAHEDLRARLQDSEASLADAQAAFQGHESAAGQLAADHRDTVADLTARHEHALASLLTEKNAALAHALADRAAISAGSDHQIVTLAAEHQREIATLHEERVRALTALTAERDGAVSSLTAERDEARTTAADLERRLSAEIALLTEARDEAQRERAAVAQRLAAATTEADQKIAATLRESETLLAEKRRLEAKFDADSDAHKTQSTVFARELKAVISQRDEALAEAEAERENTAQKVAALEADRAALAKAESELEARFERDVARVRRERDSIIQQRDSLRDRMESLIADQRSLLEEISAQASQTALRHGTVPPASRPVEAAVQMPAAASAKPRKQRKESNVIDITEAEIITPHADEEGRLKIPRIQPVRILPPQVRIL